MGIKGASALARFYFRQKNMRAARLASRRPEKTVFGILKLEIGNLEICLSAAQLRHGCSTAAVWYLKISKIEEANARLGDSKTQNPQNGDLRGVRHSPDFIFYRKTCVRHGWLHGGRKNRFFTGRGFGGWVGDGGCQVRSTNPALRAGMKLKTKYNLEICLSAAQLRHGCGTAAVWHLKISKIEEVNARLGDSKTQNPQMGT